MQGAMESPVTGGAAVERPIRPWIPSLSDVLFTAFLVWMFVTGEGWKGLLADGDTGWHIRTGEWILANRSVPHTDLFSLTKFGQPWFAWEWLSDVLFALLHALAGFKGLVIFAGVLLSGISALLFQHMMWRGSNLLIALFVTLLGMGTTTVHFLARPHILTLFLLPVSLWIIDRDRKRPDGLIWALVPLAAVWANLHGGFVALPVCLGAVAVGVSLEGWADTGLLAGGWNRGKRYFAVMAAAAVATLANPFGYQLHAHIIEYLRASWILEHVQEFQSPNFRQEGIMQFELLMFLSLAIAGLMVARRRFVEALLIAFWAQAALTSVRHVPVFGVVAAPILASELSSYWNRWVALQPRRSVARILEDLSRDVQKKPVRSSLWSVAVVIFFILWDMGRWPTDFPDIAFPVAIVSHHPEVFTKEGPWPKILTSDQWGDYLIYHYYPRVRVYADGRSDFYGKEFVDKYLQMAYGKKGWAEELKPHEFDYALLPVGWNLSELLRIDRGWTLVDEDKLGILYRRNKMALMEPTDSAERLERSMKPGSSSTKADGGKPVR